MTLVFPFSISSREASIGEQARAGDVAGFGTRQVGDKAGDLIGIAIALKRCDGNQRLREVAVCRVHVGINRAGQDVVNGDAARAEVSGKSLRESRDRSLGERIARTADEWHALGVGTANVKMRPPSRRCRAASCVATNNPRTLMAMSFSKSSGENCSMG